MIRLAGSFWALFVVVVVSGCGDGESSLGQPSSSVGGTGGVGGRDAGSAGGVEWRYATDDEGVFPKDRVLDVQVTMPKDAWDRLIATAKQEIWSSAEVTIDGQDLGTVGFRPKGEYSLDSCVDATGKLVCDKLSYKLKFNKINPQGRFYGLKRLVLNQLPDAWSVYAETLGYQIFNDFGIIAPRTSYALLSVNGKSLGLYRVVEPIDGRFTDRHFPNGDGNLYKEAWPITTADWYFDNALETNEETASNQDFIAFSADMIAASDENLPQTLGQHMDLTKMLDYMAVDYGIANWDGITTFYAGDWGTANHNYYMYQDVAGGPFTLIPWDLNAILFLDHWLGNIQPWDTMGLDCGTAIPTQDGELGTIPATCDPTIRAIALSTEGYHASIRRLLDEVFIVDRLGEKLDQYKQQVAAAIAHDPIITSADLEGTAWYLKDAIAMLRNRLQAVLGEGGGTTVGGDMVQNVCEALCAASSALECYDEDNCVSDLETEVVAPLLATCPETTLEAYGVCLLVQENPTVCTNGSIGPNPDVCVAERQAVAECSNAPGN